MFNLKRKSRNDLPGYTVTHRTRVTKRMHLELDDQGGLVVVAPKHWSGALIKKTVEQNSHQISRFMGRAKQQQLSPLVYKQGAEHLYLGQVVTLDLCQASTRFGFFSSADKKLVLPVAHANPDAVKKTLQLCYRQQATQVFGERLTMVAQRTHWVRGVEIPLSIRRMKRTWGNCSSSGKLKLNVHLIKAPMDIVDSVIAHELCHLREMNHGKRFYSLLEKVDPQWRNHRATLRSNGYRYLQE